MNYSERLFRASWGYAKDDDPSNSTQSDSSTNQNDNRVGASEGSVAAGGGSTVDQSSTDNSQTAVLAVDNSTRTTNIQTLDAELAKASLNTGADALRRAGDVLESTVNANQKAVETSTDFAKAANARALSLVENSVEKLLDKSAEQTADLSQQQTAFLQSFYKDRENSDVKVVDGIAKYAAGTLALAAVAWALKS